MRTLIAVILVALLAGCGGAHDRAVAACRTEIAGKVENANFTLDEADMAAGAVVEGDGIVRIQSSIVFDAGLPKEVRQTFDCRVRSSGDSVDVISLQFIW